MKKISIEDLHNKKQHISILNILYRFPNGVALKELTYLLTHKGNMYNSTKLAERYERVERKDIFSSRQRINDCCSDLKYLGLIKKIEKKYYLNYPGIFLYTQYLRNQKEIDKWVKRNNKLFEKYNKIVIAGEEGISKKELTEIENRILDDIEQGKPAPWSEYRKENTDDIDEI